MVGMIKAINHFQSTNAWTAPFRVPLSALSSALNLPHLLCQKVANIATSAIVSSTSSLCELCYLDRLYHNYCTRQTNIRFARFETKILSEPILLRALIVMATLYETSYIKKISLLFRILPLYLRKSETYEKRLLKEIQPKLVENLFTPPMEKFGKKTFKSVTTFVISWTLQCSLASLGHKHLNQTVPSLLNTWQYTERSVTWTQRGIALYLYLPPLYYLAKGLRAAIFTYRKIHNTEAQIAAAQKKIRNLSVSFLLSSREIYKLSTALASLKHA
ncbi:MAG: hypothetical protein RLZZ453_1019 [Chlamydiota bacterium]|jgi:hypothetical protein